MVDIILNMPQQRYRVYLRKIHKEGKGEAESAERVENNFSSLKCLSPFTESINGDRDRVKVFCLRLIYSPRALTGDGGESLAKQKGA